MVKMTLPKFELNTCSHLLVKLEFREQKKWQLFNLLGITLERKIEATKSQMETKFLRGITLE